MHKLLKKGLALAMSAAVVLGTLGLGATTVKAATGTYEMPLAEGTYELENKKITVTPSADKSAVELAFPNGDWPTVYYEVPSYVIEAKITKITVVFADGSNTPDGGMWGFKVVDADKKIDDFTYLSSFGGFLFRGTEANITEKAGNIKYLGLAGQDYTVSIKSIKFETEEEVRVPTTTTDPAPTDTDTTTTDPTTTTGSPAAGESPTAIAAADKKAWDDAKAEIDAGTKKEVSVALKADTTLPKAVLESLAGKDVTLKIDLGKGIVWTIKGTDVKAADAKDVNLKVTMDAGSVPADTVKATAKGADTVKVQLAYDGEFGFKAVLTIKVDAKYKGKYGQLFYYNTTAKKLEYISSGKVADDGKVDLTFTHASDYIIVLADQETPKTGDVNRSVWVMMLVLAGGMLLLAGYGVRMKNKR